MRPAAEMKIVLRRVAEGPTAILSQQRGYGLALADRNFKVFLELKRLWGCVFKHGLV